MPFNRPIAAARRRNNVRVMTIDDCGKRTRTAAQDTARDIEDVPTPTLGGAEELLRDFDQRAVRADDGGAAKNTSNYVDARQPALHDGSHDRKRNDAVRFAKPDMRDEPVRGRRFVYFTVGGRP